MNVLSEIIREHRKASGLSMSELAKLAGVGKTLVFDLEHGKESVRYDGILKVLKVLNISIHWQSPLLQRHREMHAWQAQKGAQ